MVRASSCHPERDNTRSTAQHPFAKGSGVGLTSGTGGILTPPIANFQLPIAALRLLEPLHRQHEHDRPTHPHLPRLRGCHAPG